MAPGRGAEAEGSRPPHGLPRDHARGDRAGARGHARHRPAPRRRAGDPAHPRPAVRLRGLARSLEEGHARALGGKGAVRRDATRRPARARADRLRLRRLLGHRGQLRPRLVRCPPRVRRRTACRTGPRLRTGRDAPRRGARPARRDRVRAGSRSGSRMRRSRSGRSEEKPYRRRPAAPFRTATLQQEASRKLRFSAQTTMRVAQRLYESGHITYMRTDSTTLSESALAAARAQVRELFGDDYVPEKPRAYGRAVANAQEAHEAIRPAGDTFRTPDDLKRELSRDEHALYDLIWKRTLASQMEDARGQTVSLRIGAAVAATRRRRVRGLRHRAHLPRLSRRLRARPGRALRGRRGAPPPAARGGAGRHRSSRSSPRAIRRARRRVTRSRRSSRRSRIVASAARRRTRRSSRRSSIVATCSRKAPRSSRPSSRSRS